MVHCPSPTPRPPMREGVSPSCVVLPGGAGLSVAEALAQRIPLVSLAEWQGRLARGEVFDANAQPLPPGALQLRQAKVWYYRQLAAEPRIPFEETLLFQDDWLLAVDKPHFLPVTPKGRYVQETLLVRLKRRLGIDSLVPMHRLDRETAGVMLFSIQPATRHAYQRLFADRLVHKVYEAVAPWRAELAQGLTYRSRLKEREGEAFMQMAEVPGEPNAETEITLLERRGELARYELRPHTGRKHQLRAQLAALGAPIVGDRIYPQLLPADPPADAPGSAPDYSAPLQLLAREIRFADPITGQARHFVSQRRLQAWATNP